MGQEQTQKEKQKQQKSVNENEIDETKIDDTPFSDLDKTTEKELLENDMGYINDNFEKIIPAALLYFSISIFSPFIFGAQLSSIISLTGIVLFYSYVGYLFYNTYTKLNSEGLKFGWKTETNYSKVSLKEENNKCVLCGKDSGEAIKHETKKNLYTFDIEIQSKDRIVTYDCLECSDLSNIPSLNSKNEK